MTNGIAWLARAASSAALLLLTLGVTLGLAGTSAATWQQLAKHSSSPAVIAAALALAMLVVGILAAALHLARRSEHVAPARFLATLVGGGLLLHVLLAVFVQPTWGTDYLRYWQHAQELVQQGKYGGFSGPYYSRALFIPYLVVRLFGPDATFALKLANIVLLAGIQLFAYDMLRRIHSHQAAQSASLLLLAAPLPAYATLIPSHDLWGMFFLAAASWSFTVALFSTSGTRPAPKRWIPMAALTGVIAYMAELQRGTGLIFCLALILAALLHWLLTPNDKRIGFGTNRARTIVYVALICLGAQFASNALGGKLGLNPDSRQSLMMMKIAANSGGLGNGKSDWYARFRDRFGEKQASAAEAADFALSIGLSSWVLEPNERLAHMGNQAKRLYQLSYAADWNWMLRHPKHLSESVRAIFIIYADLYGFAFGLLLIYSLAKQLTSGQLPPAPVLALLITVLALSLSLLLLFENKPFNIFPIWFAAVLAIAYTSARHSVNMDASTAEISFKQRSRTALSGMVLIVCVGFGAFAVARSLYGVADGRLLSDWAFNDHQTTVPKDNKWQTMLLDARPEAFDASSYDPKTLKATYIRHSGGDGDRIRKFAGSTVTRLEFPAPAKQGDHLDLETDVCINTPKRTSLEFFAFSPGAVPKKGAAVFEMSVNIDDRQVQNVTVPLSQRAFQRFVLANVFTGHSCHKLIFRLSAVKIPGGRPASNAPYVEIWMPRLVAHNGKERRTKP